MARLLVLMLLLALLRTHLTGRLGTGVFFKECVSIRAERRLASRMPCSHLSSLSWLVQDGPGFLCTLEASLATRYFADNAGSSQSPRGMAVLQLITLIGLPYGHGNVVINAEPFLGCSELLLRVPTAGRHTGGAVGNSTIGMAWYGMAAC